VRKRTVWLLSASLLSSIAACGDAAESDDEEVTEAREDGVRCDKNPDHPSCGGTEPVAGTTVYVGTSGLDTNPGTQSSPVRTIQRGVVLANQLVASGVDARVLVAAGTYRETVTLGSQSGGGRLTIEGAGATTTFLTGADDISTGWVSLGDGTYTHSWTNNWGFKALPSGWSWFWGTSSNPDKDSLRRYEVMFFNGSPLLPTLDPSRLAPGKFYVDEANDKIRLYPPPASTMSGASIEIGMRNLVLSMVGRNHVTLKNLTIQRSRGAVQDAMVSVQSSADVVFDGIVVKHAAYNAIGGMGPGLRIVNSTLTANGVNAYSDYRTTGLWIENTVISNNNWRAPAVDLYGWDSVFKIFQGRGATMKRVSWVNNTGNGLWLDSDNANIVVENCLMKDNFSKGVSLEKNQGPITLRNNRICGNGAGLNDAQSDNVTLEGNQIFDNTDFNFAIGGNYAGQTWTIYDTNQSYTGRTLNWSVTGNTITGSGTGSYATGGGWLFWHTDYNAPGAWATTRDSFRAFDNNTWAHTQKAAPFMLPGGAKSFAQWKSDLQLADPTFESHSTYSTTSPALSCTLP